MSGGTVASQYLAGSASPSGHSMGLSRDWGSCRDGCRRMGTVGGLEAPAGYNAPSPHPQSLNTPMTALGSPTQFAWPAIVHCNDETIEDAEAVALRFDNQAMRLAERVDVQAGEFRLC